MAQVAVPPLTHFPLPLKWQPKAGWMAACAVSELCVKEVLPDSHPKRRGSDPHRCWCPLSSWLWRQNGLVLFSLLLPNCARTVTPAILTPVAQTVQWYHSAPALRHSQPAKGQDQNSQMDFPRTATSFKRGSESICFASKSEWPRRRASRVMPELSWTPVLVFPSVLPRFSRLFCRSGDACCVRLPRALETMWARRYSSSIVRVFTAILFGCVKEPINSN